MTDSSPSHSTALPARASDGRNTASWKSRSTADLPDFAAIRSRRPERSATSIACSTPFSGEMRPTNTRSSPWSAWNGAASSASPLWMTADQGIAGWLAAWARLIATQRPRGASSASRPAHGTSSRP
jgi:hypothetical protein